MTTQPLGSGPPGPAPAHALLSESWWAPPGAVPAVATPAPAEVLRQQTAALLQRVYRWLEATAPAAPQVLGVVPMLVTSIQLYEAQEYEGCRNQIGAAVSVLRQIRAAFPMLPPL